MRISLVSCKFKYPWMLIIFLQITVFFLTISSYWNTNWAGNKDYSIGVSVIKHKGGFYSVVNDVSPYCISGQDPQFCEAIKNLRTGFLLYSANLGLYCVFALFWIISSVSFLVNRNYFLLGWISGVFCWISLAIGLVLWISANKISILESLTNSGESVNNDLRLRPGFYCNLLVFTLIIFIQIFFIVIGKLAKKLSELGYESVTSAEENLSRFHRQQDTKAISVSADFD